MSKPRNCRSWWSFPWIKFQEAAINERLAAIEIKPEFLLGLNAGNSGLKWNLSVLYDTTIPFQFNAIPTQLACFS